MINRTAKRRRLLEDLFGSDSEDDEDDDDEEINDFLEGSDDDGPKIRSQRHPNKERDHQGGHAKLMQDYFNKDATYNDADFERRFRMRRERFIKIAADVEAICPYFVQKRVRRPSSTIVHSILITLCIFYLGLYGQVGPVMLSEDDLCNSTASLRMCNGCHRQVLPYRRSDHTQVPQGLL
jgi:hypothetical protein